MSASASCSAASASCFDEITPGAVMPNFSVADKMMMTVFDSLGLSDAQLEAAFHAIEDYKYKNTCHAIAKSSGKECAKQLKDGKCPTHKEKIFPVAKTVVRKCDVEINGDGENGLPKVCGKKCAENSVYCSVHSKVRETPDGGCEYVYGKGDKQGSRCGKKCDVDSTCCKPHSKANAVKEPKEPKSAKKSKKAEEKSDEFVIAEDKLSICPRVPLQYYVIKNTPLCVDHTKLNIIGWFEDPTIRKDQEYKINFEWHPYIAAYLKKFGKAYGLKTDLVESDNIEEEEEEEVLEASQ